MERPSPLKWTALIWLMNSKLTFSKRKVYPKVIICFSFCSMSQLQVIQGNTVDINHNILKSIYRCYFSKYKLNTPEDEIQKLYKDMTPMLMNGATCSVLLLLLMMLQTNPSQPGLACRSCKSWVMISRRRSRNWIARIWTWRMKLICWRIWWWRTGNWRNRIWTWKFKL